MFDSLDRTCRSFSVFARLGTAFACAALLLASAQGQVPQKVDHHDDASLSAFGQFSNTVSGNGISLRAGSSAGVRGAFRHTYSKWLGWEAGYGYTRFAEHYSGQPYSYQHNLHEISGDWVGSPDVSFAGFKPFVDAGVSALIFSPTLNGGQNVPWQAKAAVNYGAGIDRRLGSNFGFRLQYRGLFYKAPDFGRSYLNTGSFRQTAEPTVGFYMHF